MPNYKVLVELVKLTAPDDIWDEIRRAGIYPDASWCSGLNGSNFNPDESGCDWLVRFMRNTLSAEPTLRQLKRLEEEIRSEPPVIAEE